MFFKTFSQLFSLIYNFFFTFGSDAFVPNLALVKHLEYILFHFTCYISLDTSLTILVFLPLFSREGNDVKKIEGKSSSACHDYSCDPDS